MGTRKTEIEATLNATNLKDCCVINAFTGVNKVKDKDKRLSTWGDFKHPKNKALAVEPDDLKNAKAYLQRGADLVKSAPWAGVCQTFACASASLINAKHATIQSIELFSFGYTFNGHVFIVLDRDANSTEANPGTWGKALVVDIWHAIQNGTPAQPVYKGGEYFVWLQKQIKIKCVLKVK